MENTVRCVISAEGSGIAVPRFQHKVLRSLIPSSSSLENAHSSRLTSSGSPTKKAHSTVQSVAPPNGTASLLKSAR